MTKNLVRTVHKGIVYEIAVYNETEDRFSNVDDEAFLQQGVLEELTKAMLLILHPGRYQHEDDIDVQVAEGVRSALALREAKAKAEQDNP